MNDKPHNGEPVSSRTEKYAIANSRNQTTTAVRDMTDTELAMILPQITQKAVHLMQQYALYLSLVGVIEFEIERREKGGILMPRL